MSLAYFDSSAFVKLVIEESGSLEASTLFDGADLVMSSPLAYAEVRAALAAAGRGNRFTPATLKSAESAWKHYWREVSTVVLSEELALHAGELAAVRALRGTDAVHLASALAVDASDLVFAAWDRRLSSAAAALGMLVMPDS